MSSWNLDEQRQEAEGKLKSELARSENVNGSLSLSTLELLKRSAQYYVEVGAYTKAELLYKRLFVAVQDIHGPWSFKTAEILQRLAEVEVEQGNYAEATEYLLRAETIQKAILGDEDRDTLSTCASIAILYDKQKLWQEAERRYRQVIRAREALLTEGHEDTLMVIENLALSYRMRGKKTLHLAAYQYQRILQRRAENLQSSACDGEVEEDEKALRQLAATVQKLGDVYFEMGKPEERRKLLEEWSPQLDRVAKFEQLRKQREIEKPKKKGESLVGERKGRKRTDKS
jgi:tetratricopeptide (TPR) repeat protein